MSNRWKRAGRKSCTDTRTFVTKTSTGTESSGSAPWPVASDSADSNRRSSQRPRGSPPFCFAQRGDWSVQVQVFLLCDFVAFVALLALRRAYASVLAFLAAMLWFASWYLTDWGFYIPTRRIHVAWIYLIPACICQLALITMPLWRRQKLED
jgi:hypothetical protein